MFSTRITSFICIIVPAVIATAHNDSLSSTESDPEVTVYLLITENPESTTREPDQQVAESIAVDLSALLDAGDGAIITLVTGDTRLAAHKSVLTARSPVFGAILQRMTLEASSGQLAIPDVEGPVLRHLVAYMYTLQAPHLPSIATQLLVAADTYGLPVLKAHCEQQVAAQLSVETAVAAAVLAVRHSCSSLMRAAIAFIKTHIFHVMASQGWADAMNSQPENLMKVIRLLSAPSAETSVPATGGSGATPTTQPHSDRSSHSGQPPVSAVQPTTSLSTFPPDDAVSNSSAPAPTDSGATSTTEAPSDYSDDSSATPASPAPTTADLHTATPDYTSVSPLWSVSPEEKNRRLIEAAKQGAVRDVEALLAAGADVEAVDGDKWTALHWAARRGHVEVARRLLAAGAAVEARDIWQDTPLHVAANWGHAAVVRLLLEEASADPNARSWSGRTPLHYAVYSNNVEAAAALLQAGADRGATDRWGRTVLDDARNWNNPQVVDMLTRS